MKNVVKLLSISLIASCVLFISCGKDVTGVSLSETSLSMDVGGVITLNVTVTPDNAGDKTVKWETSSDDVATIDANGKVTAVGAGTATITVRTNSGGFTDQCKVTVSLKMEDNFEITAVANISSGATIFDLSKMTINGQLGVGVEIFDTLGSFLSMPNDAKLVLSVKNTSGKVIPAGTSWQFRFKRNNQVLTQVWVEQGGSLVQAPLKTEGVLTKNIEINETLVLYEEPMRLHRSMDDWGTNSFCMEVLQFGKSPYPASSTKSNCYSYQIIGK